MVRQLEEEGEQVEFFGIVNTWALYTISRLFYLNRLMGIGSYLIRRVRSLVPLPAFLRTANSDDTQISISTSAEVVTAESLEGSGSAWIHDVGFASRNPGLPKVSARATVFRLKRHNQAFWRIRDASLGWSIHVEDVDVISIPGTNHDYLMREPYIRELAIAVQDRICATKKTTKHYKKTTEKDAAE
jgi:thioesterase domain-containing protein